MFVVVAEFPIDPEHREQALEEIERLVEASNGEEGMIDYRAAIDVQDEHRVRFVEQYESAGAFEAHTETEHYGRFEQRLPEFLGGDPEVVQFDVAEATELSL